LTKPGGSAIIKTGNGVSKAFFERRIPMKRIIATALSVLLILSALLSLAGCDAATASSVAKAIEKTAALKAYEAKLTLDMTTEAAGISATVPLRIGIKAKDLNGEKPTVLAVSETTILGETVTTTVFRAGEWYYLAVEDMQYKTRVESLTAELDYAADVSDLLQVLPDKVMEKAEIVKADGAITAKVALTGEELGEIFADLTKDLAKEMSVDAFDALQAGEVSITVHDGYVESYALSFGVQVSVLGVVTETAVSMSLEFISPGEDVTVNPPYGYENYPEYGFQ
jgi:hypothetical protein